MGIHFYLTHWYWDFCHFQGIIHLADSKDLTITIKKKEFPSYLSCLEVENIERSNIYAIVFSPPPFPVFLWALATLSIKWG